MKDRVAKKYTTEIDNIAKRLLGLELVGRDDVEREIRKEFTGILIPGVSEAVLDRIQEIHREREGERHA